MNNVQQSDIFEMSFKKALTLVKLGHPIREICKKKIHMKADDFYKQMNASHKAMLVEAKRSRGDSRAALEELFSVNYPPTA